MSQPSSFWVRHAALVFALGTFAAAMLAFSIALWLDVPRRYWAMTSVYITFDPAQFAELYALMSAQRNTRLLGTFARLNRRDDCRHHRPNQRLVDLKRLPIV